MEKDAFLAECVERHLPAGALEDMISSFGHDPFGHFTRQKGQSEQLGVVQQQTEREDTSDTLQDNSFWRVSAVIHFITALDLRESELARCK